LGVRYFGEPAPTGIAIELILDAQVFDKIEVQKQHNFDTLFRFPATNLLN